MTVTDGKDTVYPQFIEGIQFYGLTKREYFAAMAMQGLIASNDDGAGDRIDEVPNYAVAIAEALVEALNKEAK